MILGFAHLTLSTDDSAGAIITLNNQGYTVQSAYRDVPSAPAKFPLLTRPARKHDLVLLSGPVRVEVVSHDTGTVRGPANFAIDPNDTTISLCVRVPARERDFLTMGLNCKIGPGENEHAFHGPLPAWHARFRLVADDAAPTDAALDIEGFSCLAVYSNNLQEDIDRLGRLGAREATEVFAFELAGRQMEIVMLRSPGGAVFELIRILRK